MRKLLLHYLQERFLVILRVIDSPDKLDPEIIHVLRVELKRVRFLVSVVRKYVPDAKMKKTYAPFKALFKAAGELRGEQVNLYRKAQSERGDENAETVVTSKKIRNLETRFSERLSQRSKKIKKGMERMTRQMEKLPVLSPKSFVDDLSLQLLMKLTPSTPKKELHQNRHRLKGIIYAAEIAPQVSTLVKKHFNLDQILKLEDAIGDWHDLTILLHRARKSDVLSAEGRKAARKKKNEKLRFIYESIIRLHAN